MLLIQGFRILVLLILFGFGMFSYECVRLFGMLNVLFFWVLMKLILVFFGSFCVCLMFVLVFRFVLMMLICLLFSVCSVFVLLLNLNRLICMVVLFCCYGLLGQVINRLLVVLICFKIIWFLLFWMLFVVMKLVWVVMFVLIRVWVFFGQQYIRLFWLGSWFLNVFLSCVVQVLLSCECIILFFRKGGLLMMKLVWGQVVLVLFGFSRVFWFWMLLSCCRMGVFQCLLCVCFY